LFKDFEKLIISNFKGLLWIKLLYLIKVQNNS
jgi:hypothetical protein